MNIKNEFYARIKKVDVNNYKVNCKYHYWEEKFEDNSEMISRINIVKDTLNNEFGRHELVELYKRKDIPVETKFLAAMIWGHEAPKNSKRDTRGPWKVSKMFKSFEQTPDILKKTSINSDEEIKESYILLNNGIKRCGPNFFTKHFYFLGKALNNKSYPLIFDDRVSLGFLKQFMYDISSLNVISVSAKRKPEAYIEYLNFVRNQSHVIGCELDQIEYFLFEYGDKT